MNKEKKENFVGFIKKSKYSILIIGVVALFAFGQRLISNSFSIDTELYINEIESISKWNWWLSLNRWGLVLLNQVVQLKGLPIFVSNYLTVILMVIYSIAFNYLFYIYMSDKYKNVFIKYQFVFPILFISNPIFAEQYNFVLQNVSVAIGILMIPISLLLIHKAIYIDTRMKKIVFLIISIIFIAFGFGIYQSIPLLYIVSVVACYLLKVLKENDNNWRFLIKQIGIFALGSIFYFVIARLTGENSTYLQSAWFKESVTQCLVNILNCIKPMLKCEGIFYNSSSIISIIILALLIIYCLQKRKLKVGVLLGVIGLLVAPFYIMIVTGVDQLKRTQFNYSFVVGFIVMLMVVFLAKERKLKIAKNIMLILVFIIVYCQSYTSANLFYTVDVVYENDKQFANRVIAEIEKREWYEVNKKYKLIFIGRHKSDKLKNVYQRSEVIGSSFFEFDYEYVYGVNQRANAFLNILGYEFVQPTIEEFEEAKKHVEQNKIEIWPKEGSITLVKDTILIRLSEEY